VAVSIQVLGVVAAASSCGWGHFNRSNLDAVTVVAAAANIWLAACRGNVALPRRVAGLNRPLVVNLTQIATAARTVA
jgi:hypothetical protein